MTSIRNIRIIFGFFSLLCHIPDLIINIVVPSGMRSLFLAKTTLKHRGLPKSIQDNNRKALNLDLNKTDMSHHSTQPLGTTYLQNLPYLQVVLLRDKTPSRHFPFANHLPTLPLSYGTIPYLRYLRWLVHQ